MLLTARLLLSLSLLASLHGCGQNPRELSRERGSKSELDVTFVDHSSVKRQSIGNCWLYAHATWLESMFKSMGREVNVSESYWTYWDFYEKLSRHEEIADTESELNTSGSWWLASFLSNKYGWVEEKDFIGPEADFPMSDAQLCAQSYINGAIKEGGALAPGIERTPELLKVELNKAFSCNGRLTVDMDATFAKRHLAEETLLKNKKTAQERTLAQWLSVWTEVGHPSFTIWDQYEGKKLPSPSTLARLDQLGLRIRRALNDHQPVVLTFFVSFNAPNAKGLFNLKTLSELGDYGTTGGHIVVLHDYTVKNVPGVGSIGEGDLDEPTKALALQGELDYLIAKNSWGSHRPDRPWIGNGYSRFSWDYLTKTYYDPEDQRFYPFLSSVVFPPGY